MESLLISGTLHLGISIAHASTVAQCTDWLAEVAPSGLRSDPTRSEGWWPYLAAVGAASILLGALLRRSRRERLARRVLSYLAGWDKEVSAAAGIAAVIGGCSPSIVEAKARARCRAVPLDQVRKEDFSSTSPVQQGLDLNQFTQPARIGEIDAFISHSWHDNAEDKWKELQSWRKDFLSKHGREARVWIDKYCIDQANISDDLLCLPVFLAGSKQLVVLYGSTYLTRLWCIMEILIFLHMGGAEEAVTMRWFTTDEMGPDNTNPIDSFSVCKSKCCNAEDKEMLLAIVEAGFGGMPCFDVKVMSLMTRIARRKSVRVFRSFSNSSFAN